MTKQEIIDRIEKIEDNKFYLNMKDRWTNADWAKIREYDRELWKLQEQLKEFE